MWIYRLKNSAPMLAPNVWPEGKNFVDKIDGQFVHAKKVISIIIEINWNPRSNYRCE